MTQQLMIKTILVITALFLVWYGYQVYKQYQKGPEFFIQAQ